MLKINTTYVSQGGYRVSHDLITKNDLKHSDSTKDTLDLYLLDDGKIYTEDDYITKIIEMRPSDYLENNFLDDTSEKGKEEQKIIKEILNKEIEFKNLDTKYKNNMNIVLYALIFDAKNIHYVPDDFLRENNENYIFWMIVSHNNLAIFKQSNKYLNELYYKVVPQSRFLFNALLDSGDLKSEGEKIVYYSILNASLFPIISKYFSLTKKDIEALIWNNPSIFAYLDNELREDIDINKAYQVGCDEKLTETLDMLLKDGTIVKI